MRSMKAIVGAEAPGSPMKATKKANVGKFARKSLGMKAMKGVAKDDSLKKTAASMKRPAAQEAEPAAKKKKSADPKAILADRRVELRKTLVADLKEIVQKMG